MDIKKRHPDFRKRYIKKDVFHFSPFPTGKQRRFQRCRRDFHLPAVYHVPHEKDLGNTAPEKLFYFNA